MAFDPDKVGRITATLKGAEGMSKDFDYVAATDYDALLALYRDAKQSAESYADELRGWPLSFAYKGTGRI